MDLSNISDSVDNTVLLSETSIQYRSFEVTSLKVLDAGSRSINLIILIKHLEMENTKQVSLPEDWRGKNDYSDFVLLVKLYISDTN